MIKAAIIDIDGTLLDSNHAHALAWQEAFIVNDINIEYSKIRSHIGMGADKLIPKLANITYQSNIGQNIAQKQDEIYTTSFLPHVKPFPCVRELLLKMKNYKLNLIAASSSKKVHLESALSILSVEDILTVYISADDVKASKPDPDMIVVALKKLHCSPEEALMLGDSPFDIEATKKANVEIVVLRCGGWTDEQLTGALKIYDDPRDLYLNFENSPFLKNG